MGGGKVIEVIDAVDSKVYVRCREVPYTDECAIMVLDGPEAQAIELGDSVWWCSDTAYWTPTGERGIFTGMHDVKLRKIGYSGKTFRPLSRIKRVRTS